MQRQFIQMVFIGMAFLFSASYTYARASSVELQTQVSIELTPADLNTDSIFQQVFTNLQWLNKTESLVKDSGIARSFEVLGEHFRQQGDYLLSIEHFLKALRFYELIGNKSGMADCYSGLGQVFMIQKYYDEALRFYAQAHDINHALNKWTQLASNQKDISRLLYYQAEYEKAENFAAKALNMASAINDSLLIAQVFQVQGDILLATGQKEKALPLHLRALDFFKGISYKGESLIFSFQSLGDYYFQEKKHSQAYDYYQKAATLSGDFNHPSQKARAFYGISEVLAVQNDFKRASEYFFKYTAIQDSLSRSDSKRRASEIEILYENEKQLAHIDILRGEKLIQQAEMKRQTFLLRSLIVFFALLLTGVVILLYNNRQKYNTNHLLLKKNLEIFDQKKELEEKNKVLREQKEEIHAQNTALEELNRELEKYNQELEMLSLMARETDNAVIIADKDGNYEWVNEGFSKLFGYGFDELISRGRNLYQSSSVKNIQNIISLCLKNKSSVSYESSDVDKNGKIIWLQTTLTPIFDEAAQLDKIVIIESDVSRLKQVESRLSELNWHLERKIEEEVQKNRQKDLMLAQQSRLAAMGEMISNIAHQWRQPLNAIGIIVQNIEDVFIYNEMTPDYLGKKVDKTMELIMFMSQTIDDFRNFFKPDKEKQLFNLGDIVNKALSFVEASYLKNSIQVEKHLDEHVLCEGYPNEYTQVIINLLNNARDALVENKIESPRVCVSLTKSEGQSVLKIRDNGGGIPASISQRVFDPYFTTRNEKSGTGLGLYMSKNIIEKNMKGRLYFENKEEGVEFSIEV